MYIIPNLIIIENRLIYPLKLLLRWGTAISLFCLSSINLADERKETAVTVIETLHSSLLAVMQNAEAMDFDGRYNKLEPIIRCTFDTAYIAEIILRRHWQSLTRQQQADFISALTKQNIATYASRFNHFNGEVFKVFEIEELPKGRLLIRSKIINNDKEPVSLDYILHKNDNDWLIINIVAEGVNDLALKRAEYSAIMKTDGFDNLINRIKDNTRTMQENNR